MTKCKFGFFSASWLIWLYFIHLAAFIICFHTIYTAKIGLKRPPCQKSRLKRAWSSSSSRFQGLIKHWFHSGIRHRFHAWIKHDFKPETCFGIPGPIQPTSIWFKSSTFSAAGRTCDQESGPAWPKHNFFIIRHRPLDIGGRGGSNQAWRGEFRLELCLRTDYDCSSYYLFFQIFSSTMTNQHLHIHIECDRPITYYENPVGNNQFYL